MDLKGKRLLMMGGTAYFDHVRKYAEEAGFSIIAAGNNPRSKYYAEADEAYPVSTLDIDGIEKLVREKHIDGIFVGAQEANIRPAILVSRRTGLHFYATQEQWDLFSDKAAFKQEAEACGVPVVNGIIVEKNAVPDAGTIQFPVMIKPVDSSGAHGNSVCREKEQFETTLNNAFRWSASGKVLVEELMDNATEVFFQYVIQDGEVSLCSSFTKVYTGRRDLFYSLPLFHMYPSKYLDDYYRQLHEPIVRLFSKADIRNGCISIQSFYKDGRFHVFEAGYRLGGAQNYIFTDYQWGTNSLKYMINYALTGRMADFRISEIENPYFRYPCCNYYVGLKTGVIRKMEGVDTVRNLPGVLNVTVMSRVGDEVLNNNSLDKICLRIHVAGKDAEELADHLVGIYRTLDIASGEDNNMILDELTREKCKKVIEDSVYLSR